MPVIFHITLLFLLFLVYILCWHTWGGLLGFINHFVFFFWVFFLGLISDFHSVSLALAKVIYKYFGN